MKKRSLIKTITVALASAALLVVTASSASAAWHVVAPGETLWQIGADYGVDAADIAEANNLTDAALIYAGEELWIPVDGAAPPFGVGDSLIHVVVAGETIASIAATYGVDPTLLARENGIESPYLIYPGQEIFVPYVELPPTPDPVPSTQPGTIAPDVPFVDHETVRSAVIDIASEYGWDPYLILSLAWRESTWDQRALSPSGAVGVMQLMPATGAWAGPALVGRETDFVYNAWDNIETGIAYLSHLRVLAGSDYLALAGYFQGLASVERDGIFPATRAYALGIIESRDLFANGALP